MSKVVLVSGGNRGIGLGICLQLARLGHQVIMGTRNLDNGKNAISDSSLHIDVQLLDVTDTEKIRELASYIRTKYGQLDVLVNNAGIGIGTKGAVDADLDETKKIFDVNFYGAWQLTMSMLPLLKLSRNGRIINMSSGMGAHKELTGGYAGYRLSKTVLNGLTILLANELAGTAIQVNAMCPGWVKTDMGGPRASRSIKEGADTAVWLATSETIPNGQFLRDRKEIAW